jgi:hypothetical protein
MTASVQYWRLPDEEVDMIAYLQSLGATMAIALRRVPTTSELVWKPIDEALRDPDTSFLIAPAELVSQLKVHHDKDGYLPSVTATPGLIYSRGRVDGNTLSQTSLSANWSYLDEADKTIDKPAEFVKWGRKVMQWVRRAAPGWYKYKHHRITDKAEAARKAGMEVIW